MQAQPTKIACSSAVPGEWVRIFDPTTLVNYPDSCRNLVAAVIITSRLIKNKPYIQCLVEYLSRDVAAYVGPQLPYNYVWVNPDQLYLSPNNEERNRVHRENGSTPHITLGSRVWGLSRSSISCEPAYVFSLESEMGAIARSVTVSVVAGKFEQSCGVVYASGLPASAIRPKVSDTLAHKYKDSKSPNDFVINCDSAGLGGPVDFSVFTQSENNSAILRKLEDGSLYEFL